MTIHLICTSCIGTTIEDIDILTPCLRFSQKGYNFPDECPKRARGAKIKRKPNWRRVPERIGNYFFTLNDSFGTRLRIFES